MCASGSSARIQQRLKIEEIGRTLAECGFVELPEQAHALGLSRSTAWTIVRGTHKTSGLSAMTINRMLATDHLPHGYVEAFRIYRREDVRGVWGPETAPKGVRGPNFSCAYACRPMSCRETRRRP